MGVSEYLKRIIWNDKIVVRGAGTLRAALCALFIALIALFFTSPVRPRSVYDKPLPLPAELGLEWPERSIGSSLRWNDDFTANTLSAVVPARALTRTTFE
jgi:hypothetical protein